MRMGWRRTRSRGWKRSSVNGHNCDREEEDEKEEEEKEKECNSHNSHKEE